MSPAKSSPSSRLKPIRMNTTVPMQKSIRFFMMMLPAFLALVKPVSTMAKPACIQNTSAAPMRNQTPNNMLFIDSKISSVIISPPLCGKKLPFHAIVSALPQNGQTADFPQPSLVCNRHRILSYISCFTVLPFPAGSRTAMQKEP